MSQTWKNLNQRLAGHRNLKATLAIAFIVTIVLAFQNCSNPGAGVSRRATNNSVTATQTPTVGTPTGGTPDPTPIPTPVVKCNPPRKYQFNLATPPTEPAHLRCSGVTSLGSFVINDSGYALARVNAMVSNTDAGGSGAAHGFDPLGNYVQPQMVRLEVHVGQKVYTPQSGGDFCPNSFNKANPGAPWPTAVHGYGKVTSGSRVDIIAHHDNIESVGYCLEGTTKVTGTVEVWVEDERVECQKKDIVVASTTETHAARSYTWRTGTPEVLLTVLPTVPYDRTQVTVTSHVDVTGNTGNGTAVGCNGVFINPGIMTMLNSATGSSPVVLGIPNAVRFPSQFNGRGRSLLAASQSEAAGSFGSPAKAELLVAIGEQKQTWTGYNNVPGAKARYGDGILAIIFTK